MHPKSLLIVDDDPDILAATAGAVECGGYDALVAASGEDALCLMAQRGDIGLVLMDIQMPGMTGIEALAAASIDEQLKAIPIVLMTASTTVVPPETARLLRKPFCLKDLLCVAAEHLGGRCPHGRSGPCATCPDTRAPSASRRA
jgi:CheY-like chemotaxis protein